MDVSDFNCVLDVALDRSFPPLPRTTATSNAAGLKDWLTQWHLCDVWRHRYRQDRVYSFYSALHGLHVCIVRILGSAELLPHITQVGYLGRTHSDPNPQQLRIQWGAATPPVPTWRLQPAALEDSHFHESVGRAAATYFEENMGTVSSSLAEWEQCGDTAWVHNGVCADN